MNVKTYRARCLTDALRLVEQELGPRATVLSTQNSRRGFLRRWLGPTEVEVTALAETREESPGPTVETHSETAATPVPPVNDYRSRMRRFAVDEQADSLLESLVDRDQQTDQPSAALFQLFTDLIAQDVEDGFAETLINAVKEQLTSPQQSDVGEVRQRATRWLLERIRTATPLEHVPSRRIVALIGPTGVGKTTTIAKLAANLRLREKRRVGLITVDTYRIAAVDQLRAYADIIDLPMEVVTTPREMRDAVLRLSELDFVLIDTAGRSPQDDVQIQELKAMLHEARADEVHLVLSSVGHSRHLARLVEQFRPANPTSILVTKLDEVMAHGHLLGLCCDAGLPISYTTHGQNVPDDIQPADPKGLVERILVTKPGAPANFVSP